MDVRNMLTTDQVGLLEYVQGLFDRPVYLVGGAVRDVVMGLSPKDYDFCSGMTTDEVKRSLKGRHRAYLVGERCGTIGFRVGSEMVEITTFRTESYVRGSRIPDVRFVRSIEDDLSRRDFTVNAMAIGCGDFELIDPFGGFDDIRGSVLRTVGDSKLRFGEDPLRILRAVRISSMYGFEIESKTSTRLGRMSVRLLEISKERCVQELDRILMYDGDILVRALRRLWDYGVFRYIIPELDLQLGYGQNSPHHDFDLHEHTIRVVASTPRDLDLRWAALLHDIAKPFVRTWNRNGHCNYINHEVLGSDMVERLSRHLKFSNHRRERVVGLVRNHLDDGCELRQYDNMGKLNLTR